jgi:hypothetical protein
MIQTMLTLAINQSQFYVESLTLFDSGWSLRGTVSLVLRGEASLEVLVEYAGQLNMPIRPSTISASYR